MCLVASVPTVGAQLGCAHGRCPFRNVSVRTCAGCHVTMHTVGTHHEGQERTMQMTYAHAFSPFSHVLTRAHVPG